MSRILPRCLNLSAFEKLMNAVFFLKQHLRKYIFPTNELVGLVQENLPAEELRVLDVGCGSGCFLREMLSLRPGGGCGTGIEIDGRHFLQSALDNGAQMRIIPQEELEDGAYFNLLVFNDVLHHVKSKEEFLAFWLKKLAPGGLALVKDMGKDNPLCKYWNRFHDKLLSGDTICETTPEEIAVWLEKRGGGAFKILGQGRRRILLYDHYWLLLRKKG